jgi:hypothetical protein
MRHLVIFAQCVQLLLFAGLAGCRDKDSDRNPSSGASDGPVIISIMPPSDTVGAALTITGSGFSSVPEENAVAVGGIAALVTTATPTQLTVQIPRGAAAGRVTVTVNSITGTSAVSFVVRMTPVWAPSDVYNDVCWTGTQFVAVGNSGTIATSPDGRTWTSATSPATKALRSVAGTTAGIVSVGDDALVLFSTDGTEWETRTTTAFGALVSVCASNNRFVAIPDSGGFVISSGNGRTWERHELDIALTMSHVGYFGRFQVFADRLWVVNSLDGIQWQKGISNLTLPSVLGSAWSGTRSIITKQHSLHYLSGDNLWGECNPDGSLMNTFSDIAWTGEYFLVVGDSSAISSPGGWNWNAHINIGATSTTLTKVACSPEACVVVGGFGPVIYLWEQQ